MKFKQTTLAIIITSALMGCNADDNPTLENNSNNNTYPPIAAEVKAPVLYVGETVMGTYKFIDPNAAPRQEGSSNYAWRNVDTDSTIINTQELQITHELEGHYLEFCVTPKAEGSINTTGERVCSETRIINPPLGAKPEANNVIIHNGDSPQVGDTLEGAYDFYHADGAQEGRTKFAWKTSAGTINGETNNTLLLSNQLESEKVQFCVTPETHTAPVIAGYEYCSEFSGVIASLPGSAPEAIDVGVIGGGHIGVKQRGTYIFTDVDEDLEGQSRFRWLIDETEIQNATEIHYTPNDSDKDKYLTFCITPVAATGEPKEGTEQCNKMGTPVIEVNESQPVVTEVIAELQSPYTLPEVGATLKGQYTYSQPENSTEGASLAYWKVGNTAQPQCEDSYNCTYTIQQADLGKPVDFCVTPKTAFNTLGAEACLTTKIDPMGIQITGQLEYNEILIATLYGYSGDANLGIWKVDVSNKNGPVDERNKTAQHVGNEYRIGARGSMTSDHDWFGAPTEYNALDFIGKSVEYCITIDGHEKCINAANSNEVSGGLYYSIDDANKRGIEPTRTIEYNGITYHRPLAQAETVLKAKANLGNNLLTAEKSILINGIEWALYSHVQADIYKACTELSDDNSWAIPSGTTDEVKYDINVYAPNNPAPVMGSGSIQALNKNILSSNNDDNIMLSPLYGWPTGAKTTAYKFHYMSASKLKADTKFWAARMYAPGSGNSANLAQDTPQFVSCVK